MDSVLDWLSDSSVHPRNKVNSFQWFHIPTLLTTHIQSQKQQQNELLSQLLQRIAMILDECFDSHTPIPNKRLFYHSLTHLSQFPSFDPKIKRKTDQCLASLDTNDEGPFVVVEKVQLDSMERELAAFRTNEQSLLSTLNSLQSEKEQLQQTIQQMKDGQIQSLEKKVAELTVECVSHRQTNSEEYSFMIGKFHLEKIAGFPLVLVPPSNCYKIEDRTVTRVRNENEGDPIAASPEGALIIVEPITRGIVSISITLNSLVTIGTLPAFIISLVSSGMFFPSPVVQLPTDCCTGLESLNGELIASSPAEGSEENNKQCHKPLKAGDVVVMEVNMESTPRTVQFFVNGKAGKCYASELPESLSVMLMAFGEGTSFRLNSISLPSATVGLTDFVRPFYRRNNDHPAEDILQMPNIKVTCLNFEVISSVLSLNGQNDTTIILDKPSSNEPVSSIQQQSSLPTIQYRLFTVRNATFSLSQVRIELDLETTTTEVLFASTCSSVVRASHIKFIRSGWGPLMTLERTKESSDEDSSIILTNCAIHSKSGHMGAILSDNRGVEGYERISLSILNSNVRNQQIVGQDGIGVGDGMDSSRSLGHSGITASFLGISFWNVSSLPGSVPSASSSFRQQMIGSSVCLSNNHLSGSTVRDMNSGGSVLCSNTTFSWCSTTSDERPYSSQLNPLSLSSNEHLINDTTFDGNKGSDSDTRLNITTDSKITHSIFRNMNYSVKERWDGGSALILTADSTQLTVHNCSFVNCSVWSTLSSATVLGGCILVMGSSSTFLRSPLSVSLCSFQDWYPGNVWIGDQNGGGIGTYCTSSSISIVASNFTLSGAKKQASNGGFISFTEFENTSSSVTISNCRLNGDNSSRGNCINLYYCEFESGGLSISDTEIINTNSSFKLAFVTGDKPIVVTRSNLVNGSLMVATSVVTPHDPLIFVDCTFDEFRIDSSRFNPNFYFVGCVFHTLNLTSYDEPLQFLGPCFVTFQSCLFDGCETGRNGVISCSKFTSLTLDTCTMTKCKPAQRNVPLFDLEDTAFRAYSCTFANLTLNSSIFFEIRTNGSILMEHCRFDLEPSSKADFRFYTASPSLLNTSSVIGCTSNRTIRVTTDGYHGTECPLFEVIPTPKTKSEIELKADSGQDGTPIETTNKIQPEIQQLGTGSSTIISLSDGPFTETSPISIQTDVEIVGNGTEFVHLTLDESPRAHTTKLKARLDVRAGANLTLRSMTLLPTSSSSPLVEMNEEGNMTVRTVVVSAVQDRTTELFGMKAGTAYFFHSRFSSITGSSALIIVSGNGSMFLSDTLFLTISRTLTIPVNGSVQSGSCVEGRTSGSISIHFCKFGACSSNGRAGVIDIVSNSTTRLEMDGCQFDKNTARSELSEAEKGDDVVLKGFQDEQLTLNFSSIESFPSLIPFLINDRHPHVPPPHYLHFSTKGFNRTLAWSPPYKLCEDRLSNLTLHFLLNSRLHFNSHTAIIADFVYTETMKPFVVKNASVSVTLAHKSRLIVTQPISEIFGTLLNASLTLISLELSFSELKNTAFTLDDDSAISLSNVGITFTHRTLTHPFFNSTGRSIIFSGVGIETGLTLEGVSFVRHVRSTNDGIFDWHFSSVSSVSLSTEAFLHLEGMSFLRLTSSSSFSLNNIHSSCDGSFLFATMSNVTLGPFNFSSCSAQRGGFAFCRLCNVTFKECEFSNCSAQHGGVIFLELDSVCQLSSEHRAFLRTHSLFTNCKATATDENGVEIGRGGTICVNGTTTVETPLNLTFCAFENNTAAFGNDVFVEKSVLDDEGPDRLKECKGESYSDWPHLEVEGITKEENTDEWTRISTFLNFPNIRVTENGTDNEKCRFSFSPCRTLPHAFRYLKSFYPNETLCQRAASLEGNFYFNPMILEEANMFIEGEGSKRVDLSSSVAEGSTMFTVGKNTRLTLQSFKFYHRYNCSFVSVTSSDGWLEMRSCDVTVQPGSYTQSLISSVGCGLSLATFYFNQDKSSPQVTFTVPLVSFKPTPSQEGGLGSASLSITNSRFANLTLTGSPIIVFETSGDITFQKTNFNRILCDLAEGKHLSMKGYNFKQQIIPGKWDHNYTKSQIATHLGEDTSLPADHKWRRGSLVYWLFSPSNEVLLNTTSSASIDHPNCGSTDYKCSTLDSALESASLNSLETITLSSSSSLERRMTVDGTRTVQSSNTTQREVSVALDSGIKVKEGELSFLAIHFTCASSSSFSNGGLTIVHQQSQLKFISIPQLENLKIGICFFV
ncbi:hypothetical protein BLNAU_8719 [Blattamonas nauphoetae]|uniref:Uncharacterized protein n=1 Tax=Blattamonas nauphoetae TaxID=2049346 RepID=A0ABQ9XXX6_9EUKA|nr:hypothetical protein BLNAU_8719 [Blattamonas nauphoetae]